jgi:outer membrane protein OmpA-like peptidoglycan-associated protein
MCAQGFTTVERYTDLSEQYKVNHIVIDQADNKYIATDNGLYKIVAGTNQMEHIIEGEAIQQLSWDSKSELWASKNDTVIFQPFADRSFTFREKGLKITCLDATASQLFVGTNQGLYKVGLKEGDLQLRRSEESKLLGKVPVNTIFVDPYKVRWIGTDQGVFRIENNKIKHYEKNTRITAFTNTYEGVWIVSEDEMWLVDQYNRWAPTAVERGLSLGKVTALAADKRAQIYLASDILVQFNPYSDIVYTLDESYGFVNSQSTTLACDRQDQVWVGTATGGLFKIEIKMDDSARLSGVIVHEEKLDCPGSINAALRVKVKGGLQPYLYEWENAQITGDNPQNLAAGTYKVTIRDSLNQVFEASTTIIDPKPMIIEVVETNPTSSKTKKDGTASLTVNGGNPPYEVKWSGGQSGLIVNRLEAGEHLVTVVDANGCIQSIEVLIETEKVLSGLTVDKLDVGTTVNIEKLFFDADSTDIKRASYDVLDEIFEFLNAHENVVIEIGGHTNSIPPDDYCDRLSNNRARSVADYLYGKGIDKSRITYKGYGKRQPIASNETRSGRQKNQRVEIKVLSLGE